jgi:hypothetical protein
MTISILSHLGIADSALRAAGLDALSFRKRGLYVSPGNVPVNGGYSFIRNDRMSLEFRLLP